MPLSFRQTINNPRGVTLIELVMIIVLIGILAVSVVPKFLSTSAFKLEGGAAMVAADIRYAQELAMSTHAARKVAFTQSSGTYSLKNSDDTVFQTVELPSGVTVSSSNITFTFSSLGDPVGGGGSITIEAGGNQKTINVEDDTGQVSNL